MVSTKENRVIIRSVDGTLLRGTTLDFFPTKDRFHVTDPQGGVHEVELQSLKAVFFVKDLAGSVDYAEKKGFFNRNVQGKKIMVEFYDGELLFGHTLSYTTRGHGFFVFPGDPDCNNTKVFVIHSATKRVKIQPLAASHSARNYLK